MARNARLMAALIPMVLVPSVARAGWVKEGTKNGVTVFTQDVEGSDVKRVKAVTTVDATSDEVWSYLPEAMAKSKGKGIAVKKLGSCGENCEYIYQRISHPLIEDRHYVLRFTWSVTQKDNGNVYRRSWNLAPGKTPPASDAVLPSKVSGSWAFTPQDDGTRTRVVFVSHMDLGDGIPATIFNPVAVKKAYGLLAGFRNAFD